MLVKNGYGLTDGMVHNIIYKGLIGNLFFPDETGYQGGLYGGSLSAGYNPSCSHSVSKC
jgi:hypothetical protein